MTIAQRHLLWMVPVIAVVVGGTALAHADSATPATPTPTIGTGGLVNGSQQGSSCAARPAQGYGPTSRTSTDAWAQPDWPGLLSITLPTPAPIGCSR